MKRTDDQIRYQFFKELSATERMKVLRVFLDIPDAAAAEVNSHSIEAKLLSTILRPTAPSSGVELPFPAMPLPIAKHEVIGHLYDRMAMHQYALRYADLVTAAKYADENIQKLVSEILELEAVVRNFTAAPSDAFPAWRLFQSIKATLRTWKE